jgi:hypothetical protein
MTAAGVADMAGMAVPAEMAVLSRIEVMATDGRKDWYSSECEAKGRMIAKE